MSQWLVITYLLLTTLGYATTFYNDPWFPPLWEFESRVAFFVEHDDLVQTPKGSFDDPDNDYISLFSLGVTPWPDWYVQGDLIITKSGGIDYSYEASFWTLRYLWLDELNGDLFTLTTGLVAFFPGNRYLKDVGFSYHGHINVECEIIAGKEWASGEDWITRVWALGGIGIANQGSPWSPLWVSWELRLNDCFQYGIYLDMLFGWGNNDIIPNVPFEGYALIDHRNIDLGMFLSYELGSFGTLVLEGWYNIYAHNFNEYYFGGGATLVIPFGL